MATLKEADQSLGAAGIGYLDVDHLGAFWAWSAPS